ncbi:SRPBCC domain-containing protein [Leptospira gomenensis]|uniref:SRPBCC domain-containing protein n=1 Tax=Leptospira gomenensis TaxID=2484974 RepID=A0A5F1Y888_9LEPT|nr:SRPBCC domain-containing protein [Leptospira gomenensis]TGK30997.1 SRPBCC domain-containing protein [Leptospira gomenensis]TGK35620.1 SRPBCC domain-containing protein [Leptospira gomenensis]TGK45283.1 SRPBCC domain-containing protein [Leptospira gomenensis]TGK66197.1 SRPBCC domain-containing protein [Leptospira gomenensis]
MSPNVLKVEKKINADPLRLFRAWLNPEDFSNWFLSGEGVGIESVSLDPRPGGKFRIDMSLDGKILPHEGEYLVIEEPTKLVFTWKSHMTEHKETLVTVTFTSLPSSPNGNSAKNKGPQTLITLIHERLEGESRIKAHEYGWTSILEGLNDRFGLRE